MAQPDLGGVRIKLGRAHRHIQDLKRILDPVTKAMNSPANIYDEVDGGDPTKLVYRVRQVPSIDPAWSAMVGDVLHNLRSALDHLAWQLVLLDGGDPGKHTLFPIYDSQTTEKGKPRKASIQPHIRRRDIRDAVEAVQPYQDSTPAETELSVISHLNNYDKHRLLLPMAGVLNIDDLPHYGLPEGVAPPQIRINFAPLSDGDPVAWFDFGGTPALDLGPHISLAITLGEGPVATLLESLLRYLTWTVINGHFVRFFAGERPMD